MDKKSTAYLSKIAAILQDIKENRPLVHNITNNVTINDCANALLAIGASPVMADELSEVEEMVSQSSALVLNLGTPYPATIAAMIRAGEKANVLGIPVVLDPVGIGALSIRLGTFHRLLERVKISVIKGNMSEIKTAAGYDAKSKGVDSCEDMTGGLKIARELASKQDCIVAVTGARDIVADSDRALLIKNGHQMLSEVTGTGCMVGSLIGACCGVSKNTFLAAVAGILLMDIAGEKAYRLLQENDGIGTFKTRLFDSLYNLTADNLQKEAVLDVE